MGIVNKRMRENSIMEIKMFKIGGSNIKFNKRNKKGEIFKFNNNKDKTLKIMNGSIIINDFMLARQEVIKT